MSSPYILDLRLRSAGASSYDVASIQIQNLAPGERVTLVTEENPRFLLRQLHRTLNRSWPYHIERHQERLWHVELQCPENGAHDISLSTIMASDHARLDALFLEARQQICNRRRKGLRLIAEVIAEIYDHIAFERSVLAPLFPERGDVALDRAVPTMHHEHEQIARQLDVIVSLLMPHNPDFESINIMNGLLTAMLATHECHEEGMIFPQWDRLLKARTDAPKVLCVLADQLHHSNRRTEHSV